MFTYEGCLRLQPSKPVEGRWGGCHRNLSFLEKHECFIWNKIAWQTSWTKHFKELSDTFILARPLKCQEKARAPKLPMLFQERENDETEAAHLAVSFAQCHVCIHYFQNMCSELIHILQGHNLKGYQAFFVLLK